MCSVAGMFMMLRPCCIATFPLHSWPPLTTCLPAPVTAAESRGASSHSQRSEQEHEGSCNPDDAPGSPRGVGSLAASTAASTLVCSSSSGQHSAAPPASLLPAPSVASTGSSHLDGSAALPLLVTVGHGLRHYRVPQHLHWPDALGPRALAVYVTPAAHQASRAALHCCAELLVSRLWGSREPAAGPISVRIASSLRGLPRGTPSC